MVNGASSHQPLSCSDSEDAVTMQRTSEGFVVSVDGFEDVHLNQDDIRKCRTLQKLLDASEVGDDLALGMDGMMLLDWRMFVSKEDTDKWADIPTLLTVLQVITPYL